MENREELNPERKPAPPAAPQPPSNPQDGFQAGAPSGQPPRPKPSEGVPAGAFHAGMPPGESPAIESEIDDGSFTLKQWLIANSFALAVVACILAFVFVKFRFEEIWAIGKAALGLSFVVFVHELGHFMVAKWCDVHVTTFSIGFGPAIPGCSFQWKETTYKLSLMPIGGYVQMVGQVDGDEASDGNENYPRSYRNKSVGQRMAIISAGVIMNVILAMVCFVVVYRGPGKERQVGVIARVDTKSPAFRYGLRSGARITQIGEIKDPTFEQLQVAVVASQGGQKLRFISELPGQKPLDLELEPRLEKTDTRPMIGISPPDQLQLVSKLRVEHGMAHPAFPGSAAANANPPFEFGDRIIATTDPDDPQRQVKALPDDPFFPNQGRYDYFEFVRRMKLLAAEPVVIRVEREGDAPRSADIPVQPMYALTLGVRMQMGPIGAIRLDSPAEKAHQVEAPSNIGLVAADSSSGREGDLIQAVEVSGPDGKFTPLNGAAPDPELLPSQLKQWAKQFAEKRGPGVDVAGERKVRLTIRRHRKDGGPQFETLKFELAWDDAWRFDEAAPMSEGAPLAIPELGLAYQVKTVVADVLPGVLANNPLKIGDVIRSYRPTYVNVQGEEEAGRWPSRDLQEGEWAYITYRLLRWPGSICTKLDLKIERDKEIQEVSIVPVHDQASPLDGRGWLLMPDTQRQRAYNFIDAIGLGLRDTQGYMLQVFQTLRGMATRRVSLDNLGGPMLIANVAWRIAGYDFWEFVFFLGLISVNLAVVNFLPIPVLDGGHMVFLCYEKLRGRPANETVRVVATYAGLAVILSLFLFVTWNDIKRFFWPLF